MSFNPRLSLFIGILSISFSPILVKLAGIAPFGAAFYRVFIALICLLPYCFFKKKLHVQKRQLLYAITAGMVFATDIAVWNLSLLRISATVSTLMANLAPVWVGLISFLLFKKRSGIMFWAGTFIAIAGMVVLVGYSHIIHLQFNTGILLALLASMFYASYILITKNVMSGIDVFTFMFYSMLSASVLLLLLNLILGNNLVNYRAQVWFYFISTGLICQLTGWLTINYSLRYLEPTRVSVALLSQTVFAALLAAMLLNERLEAKEIMGSAIVLAGIGTTFLKPRNQSDKIVN